MLYWSGLLLTIFLVLDIGGLFLFAIQHQGWVIYVGDKLWVLNIELFLYVPLSLYFLIRTGYDQTQKRKPP